MPERYLGRLAGIKKLGVVSRLRAQLEKFKFPNAHISTLVWRLRSVLRLTRDIEPRSLLRLIVNRYPGASDLYGSGLLHQRGALRGERRSTWSLLARSQIRIDASLNAHDGSIHHLHRRIVTGGQRIHDPIPDAAHAS
jgi:hypothetical protein